MAVANDLDSKLQLFKNRVYHQYLKNHSNEIILFLMTKEEEAN